MRKNIQVTIEGEDRDTGKVFLLTEMPAMQAEKWAIRSLMALAKAGIEIPENFRTLGLAAIAAIGFTALAGINFEDAEPLLDEMFGCVKIVPDPTKPNVVRDLVENDIEEVITIMKLRKAVFELHTDFFKHAVRLTSTLVK